MGGLSGRVAIVTGAARGLGEAIARSLCEAGAAVMLTDILDEGEAVAASLVDEGHQAVFKRHDVRDEAQWSRVVSETIERFGRIGILVNNAGITSNMNFEDAKPDQFRRVMDVNLFGPLLGMQAVLPSMKCNRGGSIINIASNSTQMVLTLTALYGPSKAALANLSKSAAVHCAERGYNIRVNTVHPGPHETAMLLGTGGSAKGAEIPAIKAVIDTIPMKRMGRPSEIGKVVAFLASDDASYMTGAEIFVDGGLTVT